jgi:nucleoside-diphosphate-sugar epimerase
MRVFVAGATGVAGRRAVAGLVAAGHEVTGIARDAQKAELVRTLGATPVAVSLFDADALRAAVAGHDAVVNLATKIPPVRNAARAGAWDENTRIRTEGSTNLADAAIAAGAHVYVQESLAFLYGDHGGEWIDAGSTPILDSPYTAPVRTAEANAARVTAAGGRGVVLRFGFFYAADSEQTRTSVHMARRGTSTEFGAADAYAPAIDADDVATAIVAALDAPAGVYDIVDDEPMTSRERDEALAHAVGRRRLWRAPAWMVPTGAAELGLSRRVSNRRFRDATGWAPRSSNRAIGMRKVVAEMGVEPALSIRTRVSLWLLAFTALGLGLYAEFTPRAFYDNFPFGRGWVALDGRYNQHLIRDFGALNLALCVFTAGALFIGLRSVAKLAALAWIVYSVPHFVYHLRHLTMAMAGADKVGMMVSLAVPILLAIVILWPESRRSDAAGVAELSSPREARTLHISRS